eukprot:1379849-Amphidinium_carterae.1
MEPPPIPMADHQKTTHDTPAAESCTDSEVSSSDSSVAEGRYLEEQVVKLSGVPGAQQADGVEFLRHKRYGTHHMRLTLATDMHVKQKCGRALTDQYSVVAAVEPTAIQCAMCFRLQ